MRSVLDHESTCDNKSVKPNDFLIYVCKVNGAHDEKLCVNVYIRREMTFEWT